MPVLTIIAGPNGSGKSTLARAMRLSSIDPDRIAAGYGEGFTAAANLRASREALNLMQKHLECLESFSLETTLAARQPLKLMMQAKAAGYQIHLAFVVASASEDTRLRIDNRVLQGGHNIPDQDLERRGPRILANLPDAVALADLAAFYLSSTQRQDFTLQGAGQQGRLHLLATLPASLSAALVPRFDVQPVNEISLNHPVRAAFQTQLSIQELSV